MRIGFLVNPIAGMGGSVGLKGTDGSDIRDEAVNRGAAKSSPQRAIDALKSVKRTGKDIEWLTCSGEMGEDELRSCGYEPHVVLRPGRNTGREDTIAAVVKFLENDVELAVFAGGDGTARDVLSVADKRVPIIGIPTGVKMHSATFVNTPGDLGGILMTFAESRVTKEAEVMDVDEDAFREGRVQTRLYGIALVPDDVSHLQSGKMSYHSGTAYDEAEEIAQYVSDTMVEGVLYIIGPGSTTAAVAKAFGEDKSLLGTDAYMNKRRLVADGGEMDLLKALERHDRSRIIVSPIGAQGFFFGRGNQQISAKVIRRVGKGNVIVVACPTKLRDTKVLRVDTGDPALDESFRGRMKVITGYRRKKLVTVL